MICKLIHVSGQIRFLSRPGQFVQVKFADVAGLDQAKAVAWQG